MAQDLSWLDEGSTPVEDKSDDLAWLDEGSSVVQSKPTGVIKPVEEPVRKDIGKTRSAVAGFAQGTTLGFGDELRGANDATYQEISNRTGIPVPNVADAIAKGILKVGDWITGSNNAELSGDVKTFKPGEKSFGEAYTQSRDEARVQNEEAKKANPKTYGGSELAGTVATSFVPGLNVGKGALTAEVVGKSALQGAADALGHSEATDPGDMLLDTLEGAAYGGAFGATFDKAGKLLRPVADKIGEFGKDLAYKALGGQKQQAKKLGQEKISELVDYAMTPDADGKVLTPFGTAESMGENLAKKQATTRDSYEAIASVLDHPTGGAPAFGVKASDLRTQLGNAVKDRLGDSMVPGEASVINNVLSKLDEDPNKILTFADIQKFKSEIGKLSKWAANPTSQAAEEVQTTIGKLWGTVDDAIDGEVNRIDSFYKSKGVDSDILPAVEEAKSRFRNEAKIDQLLDNKAASQTGNNTFGLGSTIFGGTGAGIGGAIGGPLGAAAGGTAGLLAKKSAEEFGPTVGATVLPKVAQGIRSLDQTLDDVSGALGSKVGTLTAKQAAGGVIERETEENNQNRNFNTQMDRVKTVLQQSPQSLGKYGQVLQEAAANGEDSLAARMYVLGTSDENYRKLMEQLEKQ